ncbi:2-iminoacetate synthase ThiH [Garciella nitratireducens]|uniref:2-iminoacetate synthase n=1 Tax=Garciella nitratireducens DSM 15102 TaxID=1121911 RepID=A0A1T4N3T1_9FIRM|nr:2-iminoacetate synthase ThiH [Garciella nitratireducens]SJZ73776.1 2-iminoacetate synthase [Garciella nitratireducens DSM 15102]
MDWNQINPIEYLDDMEVIHSDMMEKVISLTNQYDYTKYTEKDVKKALTKDVLCFEDYGALLSPIAMNYLEEMAQRSMFETEKHFGNSICLFTPLYISNYCENECIYCGFHCKNKIQRGKLSYKEIELEMETIARTGLKEILILTGESRNASGVEYIGEAIKLASNYFSTIGIEIYPLNTNEYAYLHKCGADFVSVYQETYNLDKYKKVHLRGPKRIFPYRFYAQERALLGGMRGVSFGALLGLDDFRKDAFATGLHAFFIQQKYPYAEISFSVPRLRPYINHKKSNPLDVGEKQLLQAMLAYRLFMPFTGITISTRESQKFRNHVIGMVATKISAGVNVGVGGHLEKEKGDKQFEISDPRTVKEIHKMILDRGLQPIYNDYIRV